MYSAILVPTGNLGALTTTQTVVTPINGHTAALAVGDLVRFDFSGVSTLYTDTTTILDSDNKKNPLNVVVTAVDGTATVAKGGVWGVVLEAAAIGARVKVCIAGLVDAKVTTTATSAETTAGVTVVIPSAGVLKPAPATPANTSGPGIGLALQTVSTSTTTLMRVLFNGFAFAVGGA